jgi:hypothetical protein
MSDVSTGQTEKYNDLALCVLIIIILYKKKREHKGNKKTTDRPLLYKRMHQR